MLNKFIVVTLFVVLYCVSPAAAQTKDVKAVEAAVESLRKAMIDADRTALESIAHTSLSYGHSSGALDDKKVFVEKLTSGASDFVTIALTEQTISVVGRTAIVRHTLSADTNDGGKPGTVRIKVMLVWQKVGSRWQLLARQAVRPA